MKELDIIEMGMKEAFNRFAEGAGVVGAVASYTVDHLEGNEEVPGPIRYLRNHAIHTIFSRVAGKI